MKIEPRKIKKTLKYAAVGACVATSLVAGGCESVTPQYNGTPPLTVTPEEVYLDGDIATTPMPEKTPEIAGGIPTPPTYEKNEFYLAYNRQM